MTGVGQATTLTADQRYELAARLRDGYGVEDVALMLALPLPEVRACVAYWRSKGFLSRVLDRDPARNAEALRIMGVA